MKESGVYIHIPFCKSRCIYCDFYSTTSAAEWASRYVDAVLLESKQRANDKQARTLYLGGGTPSILPPSELSRLINGIAEVFPLVNGAEVTMEANPDDICPTLIDAIKDTPVNRISMGVQSLDDRILRLLRRRHTAESALQAVEQLKYNGYNNISLDLIYGLPTQTLQDFQHDARRMLSLDIPHLSAYALQVEPGTTLYNMVERGELQEADEELSLACYQSLMEQTSQAGMVHYEISNFAIPGRESRHNSSYWQLLPYVGLGAGAHSYDGKSTRRANLPDLLTYINGVHDNSADWYEEEHLTADEQYDEFIMLSLRTRQGLLLPELERRFGANRRQYAERCAAPHLASGRLQKRGEALCLTSDGLFIADTIIRDMLA